jgi:ABC-type lipoprotein export system ATPase subunit
MFRVISASGQRFSVQFNSNGAGNSNVVSVITGPNGSGKTELLTAIAAYFRDTKQRPAGIALSWMRDGRTFTDAYIHGAAGSPERVITQTFSPFTRFAAPEDEVLTLTEIYAEGREQLQRYRCVGLHRRSKYIGGVLSKHTLEQGLFRLSEAPDKSSVMAEVLVTLGFKDHVHLVYRKYPAIRELIKAFEVGRLHAYLDDLNTPSERLAGATLAREVRATGSERLSDLLGSALQLLARQLNKSSFDLSFSFSEGRASEDYAVMQALALLRRLRVLRLDQCNLTLASGEDTVDLADASSGQQQMLCSIFGLVAELRSNSLVLIDEPELSLHPTWQMSFLGRIGAVLRKFTGCHVLIATHSPLIVQSALEQHIEVIQLQKQPKGAGAADTYFPNQAQASVEGTLLDVFRTPIRGSVYLANEIFDIVAEGEEGGDIARQGALARLAQLRTIYEKNGSNGDPLALKLIEDAVKLIQIDDEEPHYAT